MENYLNQMWNHTVMKISDVRAMSFDDTRVVPASEIFNISDRRPSQDIDTTFMNLLIDEINELRDNSEWQASHIKRRLYEFVNDNILTPPPSVLRDYMNFIDSGGKPTIFGWRNPLQKLEFNKNARRLRSEWEKSRQEFNDGYFDKERRELVNKINLTFEEQSDELRKLDEEGFSSIDILANSIVPPGLLHENKNVQTVYGYRIDKEGKLHNTPEVFSYISLKPVVVANLASIVNGDHEGAYVLTKGKIKGHGEVEELRTTRQQLFRRPIIFGDELELSASYEGNMPDNKYPFSITIGRYSSRTTDSGIQTKKRIEMQDAYAMTLKMQSHEDEVLVGGRYKGGSLQIDTIIGHGGLTLSYGTSWYSSQNNAKRILNAIARLSPTSC